MEKKWYKLDNAAKIFPAIHKNGMATGFRIAVVFKEIIQTKYLEEAVMLTLRRFPTFRVKIKKGFFWFYFEENNSKPTIQKESKNVFHSVEINFNDDYLFTVSHNGKRLAIEFFHSLSDGSGALEFVKSLSYYYLTLTGEMINNNGTIRTEEYEQLLTEAVDSFNYNYDKKVKSYPKESKALTLNGTLYNYDWCGIIHFIMNTSKIKAACKKYNCTITEYIGGQFIYSVYQNYFQNKPNEVAVKLFMPINARKVFNSLTLRNFALYARTDTFYNESTTLETCINEVKTTLKDETTKEKLHARIISNVKIEKNIFVRALPLVLKTAVMKLGYKILGSDSNTASFSNLGIVNIPDEMKEFIDRFEFMIACDKATPINLAAISLDDKFVLTFSKSIVEREIIQTMCANFTKDLIDVTIETNDLEVE